MPTDTAGSGAVTGISSMATRGLLAELAAEYRSRFGVSVAFDSVGGVEAARRVRAGELVDVVVLASTAMEELASQGHLLAGIRVDVARSPMAVAVGVGRPRPGLADAEAVRRAVLEGGRIGYSTGPSGDHLQRLLAEWGIADRVGGRMVKAPPGIPVGTLVARGEADLGFQQLSELTGVDGIDIVGRLPPELGTDTVFAAGVTAVSSRADEARTFLAFLVSEEASGAKVRRGMEPFARRERAGSA